MDKIKIVALFGEAGTGKDTLQNMVADVFDVNPIVSATTRPPRELEDDGRAYHFMTEDEFLHTPKLEYACFRGWYYGTPIFSINKNKINIGVFNIQGIKSLKRNPIVDVLPIKIACKDKERLIRQLNREECPDCEEICRRFMTDKEDFNSNRITFEYYTIDNTDSLDVAFDNVIDIINEYWDNYFNFE